MITTPTFNPATADPNRIQTRIGYLQKLRPGDMQIPMLQKRLTQTNAAQKPAAPASNTTVSTVQNPAPAPAVAAPAAPAPAQPDQSTLNTMFPNERMFEPQNYQGSPLYQWQVKQGQDQLGKSLAARGLTNSGYGIQQELNIPLQAAANDTNRMTQVAEDNANRLATYQQNEAGRLERAGNNQWDRSFSLAQLLAEQNPMQYAMQGLNNTASVTDKMGTAEANYLRDAYQRIMASGGGGRGFTPVPLPSGPDYSNITPSQISGSQSSSNGWLDVATRFLGGLI